MPCRQLGRTPRKKHERDRQQLWMHGCCWLQRKRVTIDIISLLHLYYRGRWLPCELCWDERARRRLHLQRRVLRHNCCGILLSVLRWQLHASYLPCELGWHSAGHQRDRQQLWLHCRCWLQRKRVTIDSKTKLLHLHHHSRWVPGKHCWRRRYCKHRG